jgi:hypothetical protein
VYELLLYVDAVNDPAPPDVPDGVLVIAPIDPFVTKADDAGPTNVDAPTAAATSKPHAAEDPVSVTCIARNVYEYDVPLIVLEPVTSVVGGYLRSL